MKVLKLFSAFVLSAGLLFPQSFSITGGHDVVSDTLGKELIFDYVITNNSGSNLTLGIVRTSESLPADWSSSMCFDACFPPFLDSIATTPDFASSPLSPGESREFSLHVFTQNNQGTGTVNLKVLNLANASEVITKKLYATTELTGLSHVFSFSPHITVNYGSLGSEIIFEADITNNSPVPLLIDIIRTQNDLPADWTSSMCFDVCFPPFIDSVSTTETFASSPLMPAETRPFSLHIFPLVNEGTGNVILKVNNPLLDGDTYNFQFFGTTLLSSLNPGFTAILATEDTLSGMFGEELIFELDLKNTSEVPLIFEIERTLDQLPAGWYSALCFDVCFAPQISIIRTTDEFGSSPLSPGEERSISVHVFPLLTEGTGYTDLKISNTLFPESPVESHFTTHALTTGLERTENIPQNFFLSGNYPNPFNPSTRVGFGLPEASQITIELYNILGAKIKEIYSGNAAAGNYSINIGLQDQASGVYLLRLNSEKFSKTIKMILEK